MVNTRQLRILKIQIYGDSPLVLHSGGRRKYYLGELGVRQVVQDRVWGQCRAPPPSHRAIAEPAHGGGAGHGASVVGCGSGAGALELHWGGELSL